MDDKNISHIPITADDIREQVALINPEILQALLKPIVVIPLMQEFMDIHDLFRHMSFPIMFKLCADGKLDKKILALQEIKFLALHAYLVNVERLLAQRHLPCR